MTAVGVGDVVGWISEIAVRVEENRAYLTELDSAIGDADHGANLNRGFKAVTEKLGATPPETVAEAFKTTAMTLIGKVGGASGPLYGTFFLELGKALGDTDEIVAESWQAALRAGIDGIRARGKAEIGDKTMVDALEPAHTAVGEAIESGEGMAQILDRSAAAAEAGAEATIPLVAKKGRASYLGERSAGHQDPGATSAALILRAAADIWGDG